MSEGKSDYEKEAKRLLKEKEKEEEKARKEAEKEAKERAKREAEEAKERAKQEEIDRKKAEKEAKERAKREAEEAKERAKQEEIDRKEAEKEAKEREKREAKEAAELKKRAKGEKEAHGGSGVIPLYEEGLVKLKLEPPIDPLKFEQLMRSLSTSENLYVQMSGGSKEEGLFIILGMGDPSLLIDTLTNIPEVREVTVADKEVLVSLNSTEAAEA